MNNFALLKTPVYVWNQTNLKSVTTIRDEAVWGTSTIRHYADLKQLYLLEKGKDKKIDKTQFYQFPLLLQVQAVIHSSCHRKMMSHDFS